MGGHCKAGSGAWRGKDAGEKLSVVFGGGGSWGARGCGRLCSGKKCVFPLKCITDPKCCAKFGALWNASCGLAGCNGSGG